MDLNRLRNKLRSWGFEDLQEFDLTGLVDSSLSLGENLRLLDSLTPIKPKRQYHYRKKDIDYYEMHGIIEQARQYHDTRSLKAQEMDEKKQARLPRNPYQWFRDPAHYDLPGVDYPDPTYTIQDYIHWLKRQESRRKRKTRSKKKR